MMAGAGAFLQGLTGGYFAGQDAKRDRERDALLQALLMGGGGMGGGGPMMRGIDAGGGDVVGSSGGPGGRPRRSGLGAQGQAGGGGSYQPREMRGTPAEGAPWLRYSNQGAVRNQPISQRLQDAMSFLGPMGITMEVFSGGQPAKGTSDNRVGSTRHDLGEAADVFFYDKDGRKLSWNNEADIPYLQEIVRRASRAGLTGFGAGPGYMQEGSMHIGYGAKNTWGAGGRSANSPGWLSESANAGGAPYLSPRPRTREQGQAAAAPQGPVAAADPAPTTPAPVRLPSLAETLGQGVGRGLDPSLLSTSLVR